MKRKIFLGLSLILILSCGPEAAAQDIRPVSGIVTAFGKVALNKAKIVSQKSGETVYTDSTGFFRIQCSEKDALSVSASGFKTKKINIGKQPDLKIDLTYKENETNFRAAVNNGHISEAALLLAISEDQAKNVKDFSKYNSIYELISCELYEVSVKGNVIYNKSVRSFDNNPQVLYVVDDKIVTDISYINPTYVKALEFVDDVGATMYGSKGANGVIKIWLK
jgi:hypothetical protein